MKSSLIIPVLLFSVFVQARSISKEDIRSTVRDHMNEVRSCYETGLEKNEKLRGKVVLRWTIDKKGHVESAKVVRGLSDKVDRCLIEALKSWTFPKPPDGMKAEVDSYPFVFSSR